MSKLIIPDTIFSNPLVNDLPLATPSSATIQGGRLMADAPHIDALLFADAGALSKDSANLALVRNGAGDWSLNRTAAGAETYNVRVTLGDMACIYRIGEKYELGLQAGDPTAVGPPKGIAVSDFFVIYSNTVVGLTSGTIRLGKTVFANLAAGGAFTQTDLVTAQALATAVTPADNQPRIQDYLTIGSIPVFHTDDLGLVEIEAQFVMANTGHLRVYGIGCHANFNYD
jgi:hypothetical protein